MAKKKLEGIVWPNLPDDTYYLDAEKVEYSEDETYPSGSVGKALSEKANADGYYSNLTAGSAEQLLSTVTIEDEVPYLFRTSGGSIEIGDRETDCIVGGSVAFNQLVASANLTATKTVRDVTFTNNGDGSITVNGTANESGLVTIVSGLSFIDGHKYLVSTGQSASLIYNGFNNSNIFSWAQGSTEGRLYLNGVNGTAYNFTTKPNIFDLTQMFGSTIADYIYSLETATAGAGVAWFRKLFPKPYYAYNAGELMSVSGVSAHNMTGFNQWDEEWEVGTINVGSGQNETNGNYFRSKNYIQALPNTTYYYKTSDDVAYIFYYDADKNYLGYETVKDGTKTTGASVRYLRFVDVSSNSYNASTKPICINLSWDGERNGEYEPYVKHSYELDDSLTLRGIPKISNGSLYYDGDTYESDGTVTRKYGVVDLGTLTWTKKTSGGGEWFDSSVISDMAYVSTSEVDVNMRCSKYEPVSASVSVIGFVDKGIAHYHDYVAIRDTALMSYTDAQFKTAMNGVYLVYELVTPTTETADPYTNPQIVDDFGTEEYVSTSIVPVGHKTQYMPNLRAKLEMAPNSPNGNGDYIVRQTNGMNEYVPLVIEDSLPTVPSTAGSYKLTVTVTEGSDPVLSWEAE